MADQAEGGPGTDSCDAEVEQTCERVIIIDRGKVAATGELSELRRQYENLEEFFVRLTERDEPAKSLR